MRHKRAGVKLNRTTSHRQAMFRNMVTSLFKYDRIRTTDVKAKELRRWADQIITLAKRGDLHARRQVMAIVREKDIVHTLFADVEKRFGSKRGGYTRIVKIGARPGDAAPMSIIELISLEEKAKKPKKKAKAAEAKAIKGQEAKAPVDRPAAGEAQATAAAVDTGSMADSPDAAAPSAEKEPATDKDAAKPEA